MLTIREPIKLKCARSMLPSYEIFAKKITGNYDLMQADIQRTDLISLVTTPPEVYIAGGDTSSIVTDTHITNVRETKIDVINNLLNRIALTDEVDLTYRDRVYITDVLERLGVTDVSQFVHELYAMKQETNDVMQLTRLCETNVNELRQTFAGFEETTNLVQDVEQNYAGGDRITLHEDIMKRLRIDDLYQDLYNFYAAPAVESGTPSGEALMYAEEERILSQMKLNSLETQITGESVPLVYHYENMYTDQDLEETYSETRADSRITEALLFDLASDLYVSVAGTAGGRHDVWINAQNAFYEAAENTLQRLTQRIEEPSGWYLERTRTSGERYERYEKETDSIREMLSLRETRLIYRTAEEDEGEPEETPEKEIVSSKVTPEQRELTRIMDVYLSQLFPTRQVYIGSEQTPNVIQERLGDTGETRLAGPITRRISMTGAVPETVPELHYISEQEEILREEVEETANSAPDIPGRDTEEEELVRQVEEINRRNEETYRRYQQIVEGQTAKRKGASAKPEGSPASRTREESLRALEHPEEVIMEYRMQQSEEERETDAVEEALLAIMPEDTRVILEQLGKMQQDRQTGGSSDEAEQDRVMQQLIYDIRETEQQDQTNVEEITERERETERVSETVLEERREYENPALRARERSEREYETVSLVHRTLENSLDEEEIADIIARSQTVHHESEQIIRTEENTQTQQIQQVNTNTVSVQQTEDINEMIERNIRQQMGTISDEIYTQMERRLDRERKRRGY